MNGELPGGLEPMDTEVADALIDDWARQGRGREKTHAGDSGPGSGRRVPRFADTALRALVETVAARARGEDPPIPMPEDWPEMRRMFGGGWRPGLYVIAGRTGSGRTALGLQAAYAAGTALYVSLELGADELLARLLARPTGIAWPRLLWGGDDSGRLTAHELEAVHETAGELGEDLRRLLIFEPGPDEAHVETIARCARKLVMMGNGGPPLIIVDYVQLLRGADARGERELRERVRSAAYALRELSRPRPEEDWPGCAVLALSSLARARYEVLESTEALRKASDGELLALAKESGEIEYSADVVLALAVDRPEYGAQHRRALLRLAKGRASPARADGVELRFHGALAYYEETGRAELRDEHPSDEEKIQTIVRYVGEHPAASKSNIAIGVGGNAQHTRNLIDMAVDGGLIRRQPVGRAFRHYPVPAGQAPGLDPEGTRVPISPASRDSVPPSTEAGSGASESYKSQDGDAVGSEEPGPISPAKETRESPGPAKPVPDAEGSPPVGGSPRGAGGDEVLEEAES